MEVCSEHNAINTMAEKGIGTRHHEGVSDGLSGTSFQRMNKNWLDESTLQVVVTV